MSILLLKHEKDNLRAALVEQGKLYAYAEERKQISVAEDQIYLAIADRAIKGVSALFVRLPAKTYGFLPIKQGEKPPASGEPVLVQVKRPPNGQKKAMVSQDIALTAAHLIYLPFSDHFRISSKVDDPADKAHLKSVAKALMPAVGGIILRSSALQCDANALAEELQTLFARWQEIVQQARILSAPALLWSGNDLLTSFLQNDGERIEYILSDQSTALPDTLSLPVRYADDPFMLYTIDHKLESSLRRTVLLKSGATLVFDTCEAMTVIDVNSGMASGGKNIAATAERINTEAASEIARLLRLRGIGGMIMIDFIDMDGDDARERIVSQMREHLKNDPMKATIYGFTQLGILEMTRRRATSPLSTLPDIPCPHCGGSGVDLSAKEDATDA